MEFKVALLPLSKFTDVHSATCIDPHPAQGGRIRARRDQQVAILLEGDEACIEKMVDRGSQKQTVFSIEAFVIA